jgi:hypothetical protein
LIDSLLSLRSHFKDILWRVRGWCGWGWCECGRFRGRGGVGRGGLGRESLSRCIGSKEGGKRCGCSSNVGRDGCATGRGHDGDGNVRGRYAGGCCRRNQGRCSANGLNTQAIAGQRCQGDGDQEYMQSANSPEWSGVGCHPQVSIISAIQEGSKRLQEIHRVGLK